MKTSLEYNKRAGLEKKITWRLLGITWDIHRLLGTSMVLHGTSTALQMVLHGTSTALQINRKLPLN